MRLLQQSSRCHLFTDAKQKKEPTSELVGIALDLVFQFVAGMKGRNPSRFDGNGLAGTGVSTGSGGLRPYLKVAEARNSHVLAFNQAVGNQVKERVDHVLGFPLVQTNLLKQQFSELGFGQRGCFHAFKRQFHDILAKISNSGWRRTYSRQVRKRAPNRLASTSMTFFMALSIWDSVKVASSLLNLKRIVKLFSLADNPAVDPVVASTATPDLPR